MISALSSSKIKRSESVNSRNGDVRAQISKLDKWMPQENKSPKS